MYMDTDTMMKHSHMKHPCLQSSITTATFSAAANEEVMQGHQQGSRWMKKLPTRVTRKKWRRQGNHFSHLFLLAMHVSRRNSAGQRGRGSSTNNESSGRRH
jgi:hypothetical protein